MNELQQKTFDKILNASNFIEKNNKQSKTCIVNRKLFSILMKDERLICNSTTEIISKVCYGQYKDITFICDEFIPNDNKYIYEFINNKLTKILCIEGLDTYIHT
jgi:hypothetical protein